MGTYRKYTLNTDYFKEINSREKAYWLGFLYADGSIDIRFNNGNIRAIKLDFLLKDADILERFKKDIESDIPIKEKILNYKNKKLIYSRLIINNTEFCKNLINLGCTPNKTLTITFPIEDIVPEKLQADFIRGYFDGDGCIYIGKDNQIQINILGTENLLSGINKFFEKNGCNKGNVKKHPKANVYQLDYHGNKQAFNIFKTLYNNEPFCMGRKKDKFYSYFMINHGSYKFFQNIWCDSYPCHKMPSKEPLSCLWCYCPLYLHNDCGGQYIMLPNGIKDCSNCLVPHNKNNYDLIINKLRKYFKNNKIKEK